MTGMMTCLLCVVSCGFGCSCGLFVIAIVWIYMRPLLGSSFGWREVSPEIFAGNSCGEIIPKVMGLGKCIHIRLQV